MKYKSLVYSVCLIGQLAGCKKDRPSSFLNAAETAYDFAAEEAASKLANGTWRTASPAPGASFQKVQPVPSSIPFIEAINKIYPDEYIAKLTSIAVTYDSDSGDIVAVYEGTRENYQRITTRDLPKNVSFIISTNRNSNVITYDYKNSKKDNAEQGRFLPKVSTTTKVIAGVTSPLWAPILLPLYAINLPFMMGSELGQYLKERKAVENGLMDATAVMGIDAFLNRQLNETIADLSAKNPNMAYLTKVMQRKLKQEQIRLQIANYISFPPSTKYANSETLGQIFVKTATVDLNNIDAKGTDFLVIGTPNDSYKITILPGFAIQISYQDSSSSRTNAWSVRNTLTRTQLLPNLQAACKVDCFVSGHKNPIWDANNLHEFNAALGQVYWLLEANKANFGELSANISPFFEDLRSAMAELAKPAPQGLPTASKALPVNDQQPIPDDFVDLDLEDSVRIPLLTADEIAQAYLDIAGEYDASSDGQSSSDAPDADGSQASDSESDSRPLLGNSHSDSAPRAAR